MTEVNHFELLVEEPSMEAFLKTLLPRLLPQDRTFQVHPFQGKQDLLSKLQARSGGMRPGCRTTTVLSWLWIGTTRIAMSLSNGWKTLPPPRASQPYRSE